MAHKNKIVTFLFGELEQKRYLCGVHYNKRSMKYSEFYRLIEQHGWTIKGGKGHYKYVHPDFPYFIPVGRHKTQEIPKGTLEGMLKAAGLK
jgi:predicted RNA binding protein YcfA (HicA-like mRNA interferase family)